MQRVLSGLRNGCTACGGIRKCSIILAACVLVILWFSKYEGEAENVGILDMLSTSPFVVVIDAGHGGFDPGKVGCDGTLEKDINLAIALQLKEILEKEKITVLMTREEDKAVGEGNEISKKQDMNSRVELINTSEADLAVSIHQNSFTQESSKGAQVFYHTGSAEGATLARLIQEEIKLVLQDGNHRMEKSDNSYYMLKKTTCPLVIVECGFLSNYSETALLKEEAYQKKVAEGIAAGIMKYLEGKGKEEVRICKDNLLVI